MVSDSTLESRRDDSSTRVESYCLLACFYRNHPFAAETLPRENIAMTATRYRALAEAYCNESNTPTLIECCSPVNPSQQTSRRERECHPLNLLLPCAGLRNSKKEMTRSARGRSGRKNEKNTQMTYTLRASQMAHTCSVEHIIPFRT